MNETSVKDSISMPAAAVDDTVAMSIDKIELFDPTSVVEDRPSVMANVDVAAKSGQPKPIESIGLPKLLTTITKVKSQQGHQFILPSPPPLTSTLSPIVPSNPTTIASSVIKIQSHGLVKKPKLFLSTQADLTITPKQKMTTVAQNVPMSTVMSVVGQAAMPPHHHPVFKKTVRIGKSVPPLSTTAMHHPVVVNMSKNMTMVRQVIHIDKDVGKTIISKKQTPSMTITTKLLPNVQGTMAASGTTTTATPTVQKVLTVADLMATKKNVGTHLTPNITLTLASTLITSTPTTTVPAGNGGGKSVDSTINSTLMSEQSKLIFSNAFMSRHLISSDTDNPKMCRMVNFQITNGKISEPNNSTRTMLTKPDTPKPVTPPPDDSLTNNSILSGILSASNGETSRTLVSLSPPKTPVTLDAPPTPAQQTVNITNGQLSNPNGPIKLLAGSPTVKQSSRTAARNKLFEALKQSPRTLKRSISLTSSSDDGVGKRKRNRARIPSEPFAAYKPRAALHARKPPPLINIEENNLSTICSSLFDSLECTEKLDDGLSEKNKTIGPIAAGLSLVEAVQQVEPTKAADIVVQAADDPMKCLKWRNAIGYMCFSSVHFKSNEFNLIETMDDADMFRNNIDQQFERQLNEDAAKMLSVAAAAIVATPTNPQIKQKATTQPIGDNVRGLSTAMARSFSWELYFKLHGGWPAPLNLFINPYPLSTNMFEVGMKLEAIDPEHASLFCVCTIVERIGYRIKLHFDGYSTKFDFWKNADSLDIFPPGWCARTNRQLEPPAGYETRKFDWQHYLDGTRALGASRSYFTHLNSSGTAENPFRVGMKLEADDLKNSRKVCVASVIDVLDNRVLISFDGWDDAYDYWTDVSSPYIHPINWHQQNHVPITCPPNLGYNFTWERYLATTGSQAAPANVFSCRQPMGFVIGMKFEIVDEKNPTLIRPTTVTAIRGYSVQVLFDGWPSNYQFWTEDDNPDIHPVNWCQKTEHPLEPPPPNADSLIFKAACGVLGCREIGNAKNPDSNSHKCLSECPYESRNWHNENTDKSARLSSLHRVRKSLKRRSINASTPNSHIAASAGTGVPVKRRIKIETASSEESNSSSVLSLVISGCATATPTATDEYQLKEETIIDVHVDDNATETPHQHDDSVVVEAIVPTIDPPPVDDSKATAKMMQAIDFTRDLLSDYGPSRLWKKHSLSLEMKMKATTATENGSTEPSSPMAWTTDEVVAYIGRLPRCRSYANTFLEREIDGPALLSLSQEDLISILKLRIGPAIKIYNQIVCLREQVNMSVS